MAVKTLLERILREPAPDDLWRLHPYLLALDTPDAKPARELAGMFYCYLSCVRSKLTSKEYSALSAFLAAGSVGIIAAQDVFESLVSEDSHRVVTELLAGGMAAILETASTLQHVKAWETEFESVHLEAVWHLYTALWQISFENQPDLPIGKRQALIDGLLAAARDPAVDSGARLALIIRLFQVLLVVRLVPLLEPMRALAEQEN